MRIHFIAIGGSIMHNLAIALKKAGHQVTGSDDIIYDPAKSRLASHGLLPSDFGWDASRITSDIDLVILGMHAHKDNPELQKATDMGVPIQSFPQFLGIHSRNKKTITVCGSHGKTTTTSMIMHILKQCARDFDYAVGAGLAGFEDMVKLSDAPIIVIEGDEYLSSAIDPRPKFMHYPSDIVVLTGIAWDHINVFPTYQEYLEAFGSMIVALKDDSTLVYNQHDNEVNKLLDETSYKGTAIPYTTLSVGSEDIRFTISNREHSVSLDLYGEYNYHNLMAAWTACKVLELSDAEIFDAVETFQLPDKRMNTLVNDSNLRIIRDYAHAPSKVKASLSAFKQMARGAQMAILEIHTYSSLNRKFLPHYKNVFDGIDIPVLYYNPKNLEIKRLPSMDDEYIRESFGCPELRIFTRAEDLEHFVLDKRDSIHDILLMSSSNFGGIDWKRLK